MTRGQLGGVIEMDREVLDQLLNGLVSSGLLTMPVVDGVRVYRGRS
jgi:hypothetical protein